MDRSRHLIVKMQLLMVIYSNIVEGIVEKRFTMIKLLLSTNFTDYIAAANDQVGVIND